MPEVVLEHPELVAQLHREFVRAGSDVVEAFTYYAHREKLKIIDKEHLLEDMNRGALSIAKEVADETGALLAGDICNTNVFVGDDASRKAVREMFEEQVAWAAEADVDFVIGETFGWGEEALIALEVIKAAGLPAVITFAIHREEDTREGWPVEDACKRLEDAGADVVGMNCIRGPRTMLPLLERIRERVTTHVAALPVPTARPRRSRASRRSEIPTVTSFPAIGRSRPHSIPSPATGTSSRTSPARRTRSASTTSASAAAPARTTSALSPRGWPYAARQPVLAGHVEARLLRHGRTRSRRVQGVRCQL